MRAYKCFRHLKRRKKIKSMRAILKRPKLKQDIFKQDDRGFISLVFVVVMA